MGLCAVGEHGPDLAFAIAGGFKDDVAAVGSPTGTLVLAAVAGDLNDLAGGGIHDVDVEIAVRPAPTEGDHLAIGRPGRIDEVALVWQIEFGGFGSLALHHVRLADVAPIAYAN